MPLLLATVKTPKLQYTYTLSSRHLYTTTWCLHAMFTTYTNPSHPSHTEAWGFLLLPVWLLSRSKYALPTSYTTYMIPPYKVCYLHPTWHIQQARISADPCCSGGARERSNFCQAIRKDMLGLKLASRQFRKQRLALWAAGRGLDPSFTAMVF